MGEPLIIEVADHRGRVRSRTRLPEPGASIGRGYGNDIIVDDPYADPLHLRVTPGGDGTWLFVDQGSVNGTWDSSGRRVTSGSVSGGLELKLGRSVIRFISPDHPVPATLVDAPTRLGVSALLDLRTAALVLVLAIVASAIARFYGSTESVSLFELITPGLASMVIGTVWAAGWAFTNRIMAQRFRFLAHLAWTMLVATAVLALSLLFEWLEFFAPATDLTWLELVGAAGLGALLLAGHFELLTEWSRRRRWAVAGSVTAIMVVIVTLFASAAESLDSATGESPIGPLKPITSKLIPGTTIDRFFDRSTRLKVAVDEIVNGEQEREQEQEQ